MMNDKTVWIKIDSSKEREDVQSYILSLGQEGLLGEIRVILYAEKEKARIELTHVYDVGEDAIPVLMEHYRDDNVRLAAKPRTPPLRFNPVPVTDPLERIADALESISSTLENIDQSLDLLSVVMSDCQVKHEYGSAITITGAIQVP